MQSIEKITLSNRSHYQVDILNYGAIIHALITPEGDNLVLNYPKLEDYFTNPCYLGCVVGPMANRIANATFSIDDTPFQLQANENNQHCLHSGNLGLHQVFWDVIDTQSDQVTLQYQTQNNEAEFPGPIDIRITYQLTEQNELRIDYQASADVACVIDLTNHTYWNLNPGHDVLQTEAQFTAKQRLVSIDNIPTGEIVPIADTEFDFIQAKTLQQDIEQLSATRGYDHYFVLPQCERLQLAASFHEPNSQRQLDVYTTSPGFQFYTGNFLQGAHSAYSGFCVETQNYPNALEQPHFPSPILRPGETYQRTTIYRFL